jgi:putative flippase GtrA
VTLVRALYERFRQLIHEAAKFGVVGVIGLIITNGFYGLLHNQYHVGPVTSTTIATIIATIVAFLGNRYWSFRHRERTGVARETVTFFVLNGVGLLIQDAVVAFNFYILGNQHNKLAGFVALNFGIALATVFRFWSYRRWVWLAPPAEESGDGAVPQSANPPMQPAHVAAWDRPPNQEAPGQAPDLLPTNGHTNGHTGRDWTTRTGQSSLEG